jgi:hypothetical protein
MNAMAICNGLVRRLLDLVEQRLAVFPIQLGCLIPSAAFFTARTVYLQFRWHGKKFACHLKAAPRPFRMDRSSRRSYS